ncbi:hypothetical protein E1B28_003158 [Marasmius oreades]|uniref:Class II aldolase/adducin N-terminal domain-containing protein n=1 Tax=Marasmius oreades TaxID=181124 RepID=A0A9P7UK64_9AGAR|nr:uncharacterized protein E1B28_003158 [Marasmius oreades]KAG7085608.1 hypothetical protein E1B28_003158 [Marasmius oreades]
MAPEATLNQNDSALNGGGHAVDGARPKAHAELEKLEASPIDRFWRGDRDGKINFKSSCIPKFEDKYQERDWIKAHLAAAFRYWGKLGFGEGLAGHITVRDPVLTDHYWMNPIGVHYSCISVSNLVLVSPDGYVSPHGAQLPINTAGYWIHSAIHKARPDIVAAAHCHSFHGKTWSVFGRPIEILQQDACVFYDNLSVYNNYGGVVLASAEGENIAAALGPTHKTCILRNHGLLTLGNTIDECVYLFALLDKHCKLQLMVEAAAANGIPIIPIDKEDAEYNARSVKDPELLYANFQPEYNLLIQETNGAFLT